MQVNENRLDIILQNFVETFDDCGLNRAAFSYNLTKFPLTSAARCGSPRAEFAQEYYYTNFSLHFCANCQLDFLPKRWYNEYNKRKEVDIMKTFSGEWFAEQGLPMIVECTCCRMTMALPTAFIDDDSYIYCSTCANES